MPTIYSTAKLPRLHARALLLVSVLAVANYCIRLFNLRLGFIPAEEQLQVALQLPAEEFAWVMSWLEFGLIAALAHVFFALFFLLILVRELIWRVRAKPTTTLLSLRMIFVGGLVVSASAFTVFLFLNPQEAQGTRAAGPAAFNGALITFAIILCYCVLIVFWKRPQATDHLFRAQWLNRH